MPAERAISAHSSGEVLCLPPKHRPPMKLKRSVRAEFQRHGRRGGLARARSMTACARSAVARLAAVRRWIRARFGEPHFAALGLPGGALIDEGLADLASRRQTAASLLVCLAAPRLRRESIPLPSTRSADADRRLYRLMERTHGELAHARYLALLRQVASFADACRARVERAPHAR
jgi:hypothetical protein